ncbi:hypothetical protein [Lutibaculum baratangense]|uniref:hypothetical protein n=1 Tax=Lutibaculum baratangense TaxID=1358440 RepID=UPI00058F3751|nr:hypothetical protein [Lutibaculum baratangense]
MHEVSITGLSRVSQPKPNKGGNTILAFFDCQANGLALAGCAFVRTARQGLTVWPPKLEGTDAARRSVGITDEHLRKLMVRQAQEVYRALGGTDGEWIKTWDEEKSDQADEGNGLRRFLSNGAE